MSKKRNFDDDDVSSQLAVSLALQVLNPLKFPKKSFLQSESANVLFLTSRIPNLEDVITNAIQIKNNENDPIYFHIYNALGMKTQTKTPNFTSYETEFPLFVSSKPCLMIATRVFVAEALLSLTFGTSRLPRIVNVGLKRFEKEATIQTLSFQKNHELTFKSQYFIYFITHIVLVATFWGKFKINHKYKKWETITKKLWECVEVLKEVRAQNLEVWLELLICLHLLNQSIPPSLDSCNLFVVKNFKKSTNNAHRHYHTYALWAFYFHLFKPDDSYNNKKSKQLQPKAKKRKLLHQ